MNFVKLASSFVVLAIALAVSACGKNGDGLTGGGGANGNFLGSSGPAGEQCTDYYLAGVSQATFDTVKKQMYESHNGTASPFIDSKCTATGKLGSCKFTIKAQSSEVTAEMNLYTASAVEGYKTLCPSMPNGKLTIY